MMSKNDWNNYLMKASGSDASVLSDVSCKCDGTDWRRDESDEEADNASSICSSRRSRSRSKCNIKPGAKERNRSITRAHFSIRPSFNNYKLNKGDKDVLHIFIVLGASSELCKKKTYPALWNLYKCDLLPANIRFYGFSKQATTTDEIRLKSKEFFQIGVGNEEKYNEFWKLYNHFIGSYLSRTDFELFNKELNNFGMLNSCSNRLFYISTPNSHLEVVLQNIKIISHAPHGPSGTRCWTRVMVEKPFGREWETCEKLSQTLLSIFKEEELYRIDHYLGKETIRNLIALRFRNLLFSSTWNRHFIKSVMITLKDPRGVRYKSKYFDRYGIIRDVMQNHLLRILSLIAMEKPLSTKPHDIRDEKVKVLKYIPPVAIEDVVIGQYIGNPKAFEGDDERDSYTDEPDVPKKSLTPTFCTAVLKIRNERWDGVPFILKCGLAMDEKLARIQVQFRDPPGDIFSDGQARRNELIIQMEPSEGVYLKAMTTIPSNLLDKGETDITIHRNKYGKTYQTFEGLILDVFCGSQTNFVRTDELTQGWRIFAPLLKFIEINKLQPLLYINGSNGPKEADELIRKHKFIIYE